MKILNRTTLAAALLVASGSVFAAVSSAKFDVDLEAIVPPADGLFVTPVGNWNSTTVPMSYNSTRESLDEVNERVNLKSGQGKIEAYLEKSASLISGSNTIPLVISVNDQVLDETAANKVEVLNAAQALIGHDVGFKIIDPGSKHDEGTYRGSVTVMFESGTP